MSGCCESAAVVRSSERTQRMGVGEQGSRWRLPGADGGAIPRAVAAYKDFLTLWKDADAGIPIYRQANAEYAKLQ